MGAGEEIRTAGRLVGDVLAGGVGMIWDVHRAVADRSFAVAGPAGVPARILHDAIAGGVYAAVRVVNAAAPRAGSTVASWSAPADARPPSATSSGELILAAVNGLWGDRIHRRHPALAVAMTVRSAVDSPGRDVVLTPTGIAASFPHATSRIVVFVHGLGETERWWSIKSRVYYDEPGVTYGSRLRADLGYTPVYLRYNTGHRVSDNGRQLAALMDRLVGAWPTEVDEVVFIGHSMGGLVIRSACHYGASDASPWVPAVRQVFCLGTPHLGAPLERGVNAAAWLLGRLPETRPVAGLLNLRSVGVKDLRYGAVVEEDWQGVDADEFLRDRCTEVPLLAHATHYFIGATVTKDHRHPLGARVGDMLVQFPSASGQGRRRRIPFDVEHGRHFGRLHHFDLLNHPDVYAQIRSWLQQHAAQILDDQVG